MVDWLKDWLLTAATQMRNSAPVTVALSLEWMGHNLDLMYKLALLVYVVLQAGYLVWKWHRDWTLKGKRDGKQT